MNMQTVIEHWMSILRLELNISIFNPSQILVISATGLVEKASESRGEPIYYGHT